MENVNKLNNAVQFSDPSMTGLFGQIKSWITAGGNGKFGIVSTMLTFESSANKFNAIIIYTQL